MRRTTRAGVVTAAAGVVALGAWGGWHVLGPHEHLPVPPASASPADVVRAYVRATQSRDFDTARWIAPGERLAAGIHWWDLDEPQVRNVEVTRVSRVLPSDGSEVAPRGGQSVSVAVTATLVDIDGTGQTQPGSPWFFSLYRATTGDPWRVVDEGSGP